MASSVVMYMLFLALALHRVRQLDCFTPVPISLAVDYKHTELFGKGDGKKRRKKKSSSPAPNSSPEALQPAPLRVTSDSNVPVKRQIQWARMNKVSLLSSSSSLVMTSLNTLSCLSALLVGILQVSDILQAKQCEEENCISQAT